MKISQIASSWNKSSKPIHFWWLACSRGQPHKLKFEFGKRKRKRVQTTLFEQSKQLSKKWDVSKKNKMCKHTQKLVESEGFDSNHHKTTKTHTKSVNISQRSLKWNILIKNRQNRYTFGGSRGQPHKLKFGFGKCKPKRVQTTLFEQSKQLSKKWGVLKKIKCVKNTPKLVESGDFD